MKPLARPLAAAAAFVLLGCSRPDLATSTPAPVQPEPPQQPEPAASALAHAVPEPAADAPSLYDLPVALTDESGVVRPLESFRGRPLLITMFYGSCATACPLLTRDLKRIERDVPEPARAELRVMMVSFDAARDTPGVLARMKRERDMDPARWTLASAEEDAARSLAGALGIRYRKLDDGEYFHSSVIVLLDSQGRVRVKLDGLGRDTRDVVALLAAPRI